MFINRTGLALSIVAGALAAFVFATAARSAGRKSGITGFSQPGATKKTLDPQPIQIDRPMVWSFVDPIILEPGSKVRVLLKSDPSALGFAHVALVASDETAKALLFGVDDVFRLGFIDLGNNANHLGYSLMCALYRALVSAFVIVIVLRLMGKRKDRIG